jgi:pimeloyl-ACP methyl ester carboxylesterase
MANYLFIHGGWHGAWCWSRVLPLLEKQRHRPIAIDLPSHGRDRTPTSKVTMKDYVDAVVAHLDAVPEPVVLVGHSSGGAIATQAAEERPSKVRSLVYLAAFLPRNGETILGLLQQATESALHGRMIPSADQTQLTIPDEALRECFYAGCRDEDVALAKLCLTPQPIAPAVTPVVTTPGNFGRVPRVYIETLRDRAVPTSFQRTMREALPCEKVFTLDTDHSPFFSAPEKLAEHLLAV